MSTAEEAQDVNAGAMQQLPHGVQPGNPQALEAALRGEAPPAPAVAGPVIEAVPIDPAKPSTTAAAHRKAKEERERAKPGRADIVEHDPVTGEVAREPGEEG
jgi:hypothetical protein